MRYVNHASLSRAARGSGLLGDVHRNPYGRHAAAVLSAMPGSAESAADRRLEFQQWINLFRDLSGARSLKAVFG
jgi:hypothetical protein